MTKDQVVAAWGPMNWAKYYDAAGPFTYWGFKNIGPEDKRAVVEFGPPLGYSYRDPLDG